MGDDRVSHLPVIVTVILKTHKTWNIRGERGAALQNLTYYTISVATIQML